MAPGGGLLEEQDNRTRTRFPKCFRQLMVSAVLRRLEVTLRVESDMYGWPVGVTRVCAEKIGMYVSSRVDTNSIRARRG